MDIATVRAFFMWGRIPGEFRANSGDAILNSSEILNLNCPLYASRYLFPSGHFY